MFYYIIDFIVATDILVVNVCLALVKGYADDHNIANDPNNQDIIDTFLANYWFAQIYFLGAFLILCVRMILKGYIIVIWVVRKDPSYADSRVKFYSFFVIGIIEIVWLVIGLNLIPFIHVYVDEFNIIVDKGSDQT